LIVQEVQIIELVEETTLHECFCWTFYNWYNIEAHESQCGQWSHE
jgi:hypothetical protein